MNWISNLWWTSCPRFWGRKTSYRNLSWKKNNSLIKSWILRTLLEDVLYLVSVLPAAKQVGNHLKKLLPRTLKIEKHFWSRNYTIVRKILLFFQRTKVFVTLEAKQKLVYDDNKVKLLVIGLGPKYINFVDSQLSNPLIQLSLNSSFI